MTSEQVDGVASADPTVLPQELGGTALLSFWLGPVQSFIATAHTTRDLWTGSYLLSWLTLHAIKTVVERCGGDRKSILFPDVVGNQLLTRLMSKSAGARAASPDELHACLPNVFMAQVPHSQSEQIATEAEETLKTEWRRVSSAVRNKLKGRWQHLSGQGWDKGWDEQVDHFFDTRCLILPPSSADYPARFDMIGKLLAADKMIRHVPPPEQDWDTRPKDSLMGSYAQMGPVEISLGELNQWWEKAANATEAHQIRAGEKLSAVSLTKRLAWRTDLHKQLGLKPDERTFPDTATIAAREWLEADPKINSDAWTDWTGHWLHWAKSNQGDEGKEPHEPQVPPKLWDVIRAKRAAGGVPLYYAVLMMDGDNMGGTVREVAKDDKSHRDFSGMMAAFASQDVPPIVEKHHKVEKGRMGDEDNDAYYRGTLIYSGGDDVLAMLPTASAMACGDEIRRKFASRVRPLPAGGEEHAAMTMSGGLVIAHYKEDLRFVLQQARAAERQAKDVPGKSALCVRILKRGGEHASAVCAWDQIDSLQKLVRRHADPGAKVSDRWAHHLTGESAVLREFDGERGAVAGRIRYLLDHSEGVPPEVRKEAMAFWESFVAETCGRMGRPFAGALDDYCFLMRAVPFLANGREATR